MGHTISAMVGPDVVQVRCNTCGGIHRYRSGLSKGAATGGVRRSRVAAAASTSVAISKARQRFRDRIAALDAEDATPYSPRLKPTEGQLIRHVKFGLGIVGQIAAGKANIAFEDGDKLLVIGR